MTETTLTAYPWAMQPAALSELLAGRTRAEITARVPADTPPAPDHAAAIPVALSGAVMLDGAANAVQVGRTAVIPVRGVVRPQASFFDALFGSGTASLAALVHDIDVAAANPGIDAILLSIDSPGGVVTGVADAAARIRAAAQSKTVIAHSAGMLASAAYWLGAAADRVVLSTTAEAGSIGVQMVAVDWSKYDERIGIREIVIRSSQSPNKNLDPATDEGRASHQARIDDLAAVFISDVAQFRGVSESAVVEEFGGGDMMVGARAVAAGLADDVASIDTVLAELERSNNGSNPSMADIETVAVADITAEWLRANAPDVVGALLAEGHDSGYSQGHEAGMAEGAESERARIQAIEAQVLPGLEKFAATVKFDGAYTPERFATEAMAKMAAGDIDMAAVLAGETPDPVPGAEGSGDPDTPADVDDAAVTAAREYAAAR